MMAVEHAEAPGRHHQQPGAGKEDAHQRIVSSRLAPVNPGAIAVDQVRRGQHAQRDQDRNPEREHRAHAPRQRLGRFLVALAQKLAVDRDEGGREHALAEQVLQDVGDADAGLEGVGGVGVAEVMREDAFANEAGDAAQQDTGRDQPCQVGAQACGEQPAGRRIGRRAAACGAGAASGCASRLRCCSALLWGVALEYSGAPRRLVGGARRPRARRTKPCRRSARALVPHRRACLSSEVRRRAQDAGRGQAYDSRSAIRHHRTASGIERWINFDAIQLLVHHAQRRGRRDRDLRAGRAAGNLAAAARPGAQDRGRHRRRRSDRAAAVFRIRNACFPVERASDRSSAKTRSEPLSAPYRSGGSGRPAAIGREAAWRNRAGARRGSGAAPW